MEASRTVRTVLKERAAVRVIERSDRVTSRLYIYIKAVIRAQDCCRAEAIATLYKCRTGAGRITSSNLVGAITAQVGSCIGRTQRWDCQQLCNGQSSGITCGKAAAAYRNSAGIRGTD